MSNEERLVSMILAQARFIITLFDATEADDYPLHLYFGNLEDKAAELGVEINEAILQKVANKIGNSEVFTDIEEGLSIRVNYS